jgi:transposase
MVCASAGATGRVAFAVGPHRGSWTAATGDERLQSLNTIRVLVTGEGYHGLRRFGGRWPSAEWAIEA